MAHRFAELAFTPAVAEVQRRAGSRASYARMEAGDPFNDRLTAPEAAFIQARDSFYLASVGETGWPYIQHRGGPPGFVRVLDERTLAFADFRGNRQYITLGNLAGTGRVALFFMDYANRARLKLLGEAEAVESDPDLLARLTVPGYRAKVERALVIRVAAFDWNCPQHITERYTLDEIATVVAPLQARVAQLEAALALAGQPLPQAPDSR